VALAQLSIGGGEDSSRHLPEAAVRYSAAEPAQVDAVLDVLGLTSRLVIDADLAGLNLVLHRLMRRGLLDVLETAVLPREPIPYLTRLGVPADPAEQLRLAVSATARLVGVIKDDSGGVCVDRAALKHWPAGERSDATDGRPARAGPDWWLRAVVDDQRLCNGAARGLTVRRLGAAELEATVRLGRFRSRTCRGRSLQLACDEALIVTDGQRRAQPRSKRTFWSEPTLWRLALPAPSIS
jgi:hypothetical protein